MRIKILVWGLVFVSISAQGNRSRFRFNHLSIPNDYIMAVGNFRQPGVVYLECLQKARNRNWVKKIGRVFISPYELAEQRNKPLETNSECKAVGDQYRGIGDNIRLLNISEDNQQVEIRTRFFALPYRPSSDPVHQIRFNNFRPKEIALEKGVYSILVKTHRDPEYHYGGQVISEGIRSSELSQSHNVGPDNFAFLTIKHKLILFPNTRNLKVLVLSGNQKPEMRLPDNYAPYRSDREIAAAMDLILNPAYSKRAITSFLRLVRSKDLTMQWLEEEWLGQGNSFHMKGLHEWVRLLGSRSYSVREKATKALETSPLTHPFLALQAAKAHQDLEIKSRLKRLARKPRLINDRWEAIVELLTAINTRRSSKLLRMFAHSNAIPGAKDAWSFLNQ